MKTIIGLASICVFGLILSNMGWEIFHGQLRWDIVLERSYFQFWGIFVFTLFIYAATWVGWIEIKEIKEEK